MYIHHIYKNVKQEYTIVMKGLEIHINKEEINKVNSIPQGIPCA